MCYTAMSFLHIAEQRHKDLTCHFSLLLLTIRFRQTLRGTVLSLELQRAHH